MFCFLPLLACEGVSWLGKHSPKIMLAEKQKEFSMPNRDVSGSTCDAREMLPKERRLKYRYGFPLAESNEKNFVKSGE